MTASSTIRKQRLKLDIEVTRKQKKALLSVLKALDIEVKPRELTEEEEDFALGIAVEEGKKEGRLSEKEQEEFLKWMQNEISNQ
ncbi:hypothetical protein FHS57_000127 [Runella defluvii]|uniref:Uncharacterized protein n=1 Tax=Runella defluvii TaxID=370973 RepID=A0A7W6EN43_9BACT|nr:hypothetical protein [Runella defluvii]MBB3836145.1 hypothetical protein [Runella defluvii]